MNQQNEALQDSDLPWHSFVISIIILPMYPLIHVLVWQTYRILCHLSVADPGGSHGGHGPLLAPILHLSRMRICTKQDLWPPLAPDTGPWLNILHLAPPSQSRIRYCLYKVTKLAENNWVQLGSAWPNFYSAHLVSFNGCQMFIYLSLYTPVWATIWCFSVFYG